ncbi:hypothetical protein CWI37_1190p0010 [Hamiltosporidium tvaerminnensis]|uniref:Uncharacterized protein n=1 Tax=Hamiltosporidium tvaerminnensis TaxID=1176355 RepID=A0A4V2JUE3_9MICR|nr:hypothetical protein CWI37_1190p0010 [Hamiltosporidium tvaerminnensis]
MSGKDSNTMDDATSPKRAKRLTKYSTTWETSHPWSKEVKNNTFKAFCTICNKELSYAHGEISDKKHHAYSASHIYIIKTRSSSALSKFINKPNDTVLEFKISVSLEEITCVYHTVKHGLSSNSMDCGHKLLPTVCSDSKIAQKFSCGRTKATAIVSELAKESINEVLKSLKEKIHPFPLPMILAIRKTEKCFQLSHFQDEDNECPTSLQNIFISEEEENKILAYFAFLHNVMFSLENTMKKLESDSLTVVEMHV